MITENKHSFTSSFSILCLDPVSLMWSVDELWSTDRSEPGGVGFCSAVPYSSFLPSGCLGFHSLCPRTQTPPWRANRPCSPKENTRDPSPATGSWGTPWSRTAVPPASSSWEVRAPHWQVALRTGCWGTWNRITLVLRDLPSLALCLTDRSCQHH